MYTVKHWLLLYRYLYTCFIIISAYPVRSNTVFNTDSIMNAPAKRTTNEPPTVTNVQAELEPSLIVVFSLERSSVPLANRMHASFGSVAATSLYTLDCSTVKEPNDMSAVTNTAGYRRNVRYWETVTPNFCMLLKLPVVGAVDTIHLFFMVDANLQAGNPQMQIIHVVLFTAVPCKKRCA